MHGESPTQSTAWSGSRLRGSWPPSSNQMMPCRGKWTTLSAASSALALRWLVSVSIRDGLKAATDGLKAATEVWQRKEFGDYFQGLLEKANADGRAAVTAAAAPAQASRQGDNPNVV